MSAMTARQKPIEQTLGFRVCSSIPDDFNFALATTQSDLEQAFRLAHDSYVEAGLMRPNSCRMRVTPYMLFPESSIVVAKHQTAVVATVAIIRATPIGLPYRVIDAVHFEASAGETVAEASNLAIDPGYRQNRAQVGLPLFRYGIEYATRIHRADALVAVIHPRHAEYFESVLQFSPMHEGVIPEYDFVDGAPAIAERLDLKSFRSRLQAAFTGAPQEANVYRFFFEQDFPNLVFPDRAGGVWRPELLRYFLREATLLWDELSSVQRLAMQRSYPEPEYAAVFA